MQMKSIVIVNLLLLIAININCSQLFFAPFVQNTTFYQCFIKANHTRITLGITEGNGTNSINASYIESVKLAKNLRLSVDGMISPCRNRTVQQNVQIIAQAFPERLIDRFWISIPESAASCGWNNYPAATNCLYLQEFIMRMKQSFWTEVAIYTSKASWVNIFKDQLGCPQVSNTLLWWRPEPFPSTPDLLNYTKIGGWDRPYAKFYKFTNMCSAFIFESYYEE